MRRLLFATTVFIAAHAYAQDTVTLPDLVVTATRVPTPLERIPAGVTVIDRSSIEAHGFATLSDAMQFIPGLHIVQSGGAGGNASVFVRGTNSNHVLVLRDGLPINDPSDPGGQFNFGIDTLSDVERIEVVRGPMSSLYGSGAIGGVINLISRKGEGPASGTVELGYGIPRAQRANATLSGSIGRFDYSLAAGYQADRGFDTTPQRMSVYTGAPNGYRSQTAALALGYTPVDGTRVFLALRERTAVFNLDELGFPNYDANFYRGHDDSFSGRTGITSRLFDGRWETSLSFARLATARHYIQPLEPQDPNATSGDTTYRGYRTSVLWNNTVHVPDFGPATETSFLFGYEHTLDSSHSVLTNNFGGFPFSNTVRASATSNAGHIGLQSTLFSRLTVTADLRHEDAKYGGAATTWRTGAVLAVPEVWSRLKVSGGTAFRAPSLYDLFGVDSFGYVGNPRLRAERSLGYELGWAVDLPTLGRNNAATLELTWFDNQIHDLIQTVFAANFASSTQQNVARARTQGIEAALTLRPADWLDAQLAYTFTNARNLSNNTKLLRRPRNQVSLTLRATPFPGLTIAPELIYTSSFQDFISDDNGIPLGVGRARNGTIVNLAVSYAITPQLTAFLTARNLSNSRFEPANSFQTPGRSAIAGVRAKF